MIALLCSAEDLNPFILNLKLDTHLQSNLTINLPHIYINLFYSVLYDIHTAILPINIITQAFQTTV